MAQSLARVLILGDSFVRRMERFTQTSSLPEIARDFDLSQCKVSFHGVGGATVSSIKFQEMEMVHNIAPQVVVIQAGSNDICDTNKEPALIAQAMVNLAFFLISQAGVKRVVICQILFRKVTPFPTYNDKVYQTNGLIKDAVGSIPGVVFWTLRGFWNSSSQLFADGVHLNTLGNIKLYRSLRLAIKTAVDQV